MHDLASQLNECKLPTLQFRAAFDSALVPGNAKFHSPVPTLRRPLRLDLPKALSTVLQSAGISIDATQCVCTVEDADLFSYRRDGVTGRQAGLVKL